MALTMYTKTGCPYCAAAKKHHLENGIEFTEKNVTDDPAALDELLSISVERKVPTIVEDGKVTVGWHGDG